MTSDPQSPPPVDPWQHHDHFTVLLNDPIIQNALKTVCHSLQKNVFLRNALLSKAGNLIIPLRTFMTLLTDANVLPSHTSHAYNLGLQLAISPKHPPATNFEHHSPSEFSSQPSDHPSSLPNARQNDPNETPVSFDAFLDGLVFSAYYYGCGISDSAIPAPVPTAEELREHVLRFSLMMSGVPNPTKSVQESPIFSSQSTSTPPGFTPSQSPSTNSLVCHTPALHMRTPAAKKSSLQTPFTTPGQQYFTPATHIYAHSAASSMSKSSRLSSPSFPALQMMSLATPSPLSSEPVSRGSMFTPESSLPTPDAKEGQDMSNPLTGLSVMASPEPLTTKSASKSLSEATSSASTFISPSSSEAPSAVRIPANIMSTSKSSPPTTLGPTANSQVDVSSTPVFLSSPTPQADFVAVPAAPTPPSTPPSRSPNEDAAPEPSVVPDSGAATLQSGTPPSSPPGDFQSPMLSESVPVGVSVALQSCSVSERRALMFPDSEEDLRDDDDSVYAMSPRPVVGEPLVSDERCRRVMAGDIGQLVDDSAFAEHERGASGASKHSHMAMSQPILPSAMSELREDDDDTCRVLADEVGGMFVSVREIGSTNDIGYMQNNSNTHDMCHSNRVDESHSVNDGQTTYHEDHSDSKISSVNKNCIKELDLSGNEENNENIQRLSDVSYSLPSLRSESCPADMEAPDLRPPVMETSGSKEVKEVLPLAPKTSSENRNIPCEVESDEKLPMNVVPSAYDQIEASAGGKSVQSTSKVARFQLDTETQVDASKVRTELNAPSGAVEDGARRLSYSSGPTTVTVAAGSDSVDDVEVEGDVVRSTVNGRLYDTSFLEDSEDFLKECGLWSPLLSPARPSLDMQRPKVEVSHSVPVPQAEEERSLVAESVATTRRESASWSSTSELGPEGFEVIRKQEGWGSLERRSRRLSATEAKAEKEAEPKPSEWNDMLGVLRENLAVGRGILEEVERVKEEIIQGREAVTRSVSRAAAPTWVDGMLAAGVIVLGLVAVVSWHCNGAGRLVLV